MKLKVFLQARILILNLDQIYVTDISNLLNILCLQ